ncbi:DegV family protein [Natranaerobius thermophilus]|uniref:DegV family protein n=1 Tax=Natranaerobius thermophilus (strain ATCC BAA-1301 / DSM 18059 / JW/NM-WN-LF) TaxID=457570 RepID=B2A5G2_NATTJ|nr:DegV family protein [Natranaerobius thermophilus]ACB85317.1 degV family protein [Natranaerobius thermophilus JW/NM-WN-LF]
MIKILTDSASDLPEKIIKRYKIDVLPFVINLNGREYRDGIDINSKDIFQAIREGKEVFTSQVPQNILYQRLETYASQGFDCLYIGFSSKLSGTYQTARMIAKEVDEKFPEVNVATVDSLAGSLAQGMIVERAAIMKENGASLHNIIQKIQQQTKKVEHIFSIDDLKHLYRGGRIRLSSAWLGSVLKIKPVLHVTDGKIEPLEKQRGNKRLLRRIVDIVDERGDNLSHQTIGIAHADDENKALQLRNMLMERLNCKQFVINQIGCVLSAHLGVGGVGVFFNA